MMNTQKLFMLLLGCKPKSRNTEQHDVMFGIGTTLKDLLPDIYTFWPGDHKIHIDAWREVNQVGDFNISIQPKSTGIAASATKLFFVNLGGYKPLEFEEYHYKMLVVAADKGAAINESKRTAFYQHTGFKGADSHIDDKYGIDIDDMYEIADILPAKSKELYQLQLTPATEKIVDDFHLGYTRLERL